MPLSIALTNVLMTFDCPHCGLRLTRMGSWFKSAHHFRCTQCGQSVLLTYSDKVTLFERYARPVSATPVR